MKAKNVFSAMHLYLTAFSSINALIYQPPHPWGASDGPVMSMYWWLGGTGI